MLKLINDNFFESGDKKQIRFKFLSCFPKVIISKNEDEKNETNIPNNNDNKTNVVDSNKNATVEDNKNKLIHYWKDVAQDNNEIIINDVKKIIDYCTIEFSEDNCNELINLSSNDNNLNAFQLKRKAASTTNSNFHLQFNRQ